MFRQTSLHLTRLILLLAVLALGFVPSRVGGVPTASAHQPTDEGMPRCFTLTLVVAPQRSGNVAVSPAPDCPTQRGQYRAGTTVRLTAQAGVGFDFMGWNNAAGTSGNTAIVRMSGDRTVTASFVASGPGLASEEESEAVVITGSTTEAVVQGQAGSQGVSLSVSDPQGRQASATIDSNGNLAVSLSDPQGQEASATIDSNGNLAVAGRVSVPGVGAFILSGVSIPLP